MSGLVLDAGALIAIDRDDRAVLSRIQAAKEKDQPIRTSVALLAGPGDRVLTSDRDDLRRLCDAAGNKAVVVGC